MRAALFRYRRMHGDQRSASVPIASGRRGRRWLRPITAAAAAGVAFALLTVQVLGQDATSGVTELDRVPRVRPEYPLPDDANVLFYLQRSPNSNTVVYAARLDAAGRLDQADPVQVFWRRFNAGGQRKPLTVLERTMAFGVDVSRYPGRDDAVLASVVSYPARKALIELDAKGKPRAVIDMANRRAKLIYAYIQLKDGSGTIPSIAYVDLYGVDLANGRALRERIRPDKAAQR